MKELYQIPIGNTFGVRFYAKVNGEPENLSDAQNLTVRIRRSKGIGGIMASDVHYQENVVSFAVRGDRQRIAGDYIVTISYDKPDPNLFPPTTQRTFTLPAFRLTSQSSEQGGTTCSTLEMLYLELEASIIPGKDGAKGDKGDRGERGAQGDAGEIGAKGDRGETGAKGETGEVGAKGDRGERGAQGDAGEIGAKGDRGETGAKGETGEVGAKGDRGENGAQGDAGEIGGKGDRGDNGDTGSDGKSAYQSAVDGGFVGTQIVFDQQLGSIGNINILLDTLNGEVV